MAASQIKAFEDTWRWDQESAREYFETVQAGGEVAKALQAFFTLLGESNMMAYLAMMAPRLVRAVGASSNRPAASTSTATRPRATI